jgi:hypothetical protein
MVATFHEEVRVTHPWSTLADVSLSNLVLKGWDGADVYRLGDLTLGRTTHQELWPQAGSFAFFTFRANVTSSITANRPGQKDLYGALEWAVRQADEAEGTRTLVIVLTNGSQPGMRLRGAPGGGFRIADAEDDGDFRDVLDSVRRSGSEVYVFAVDTDVNPLSLSSLEFWVQRRPMAIYDLQQARSRFEELARVSGGRVVYPRSFEDLVPMLQGLAREAFRTAYSLGYAPAEQEGERDRYREIEVRVARPGVTVRQSRSGYDPAARPE